MKHLMRIFCLFVICLNAEARKYDDVIASGYISIAVYSDFAPYSYREGGIAKGIDIEVGKEIAKRLGVRPQWFWVTADETLDDDLRNAVWKGHYLGGGVADVMLRVPYDKAFANKVDGYGQLQNEFVVLLGPYQQERWSVARNTQRLPTLNNLAPLQYEKVGVEVDSVPDLILTSTLGGRLVNSVVHYVTLMQAIDALESNKLAAVVGMRGPLEWRLNRPTTNNETNTFAIADDSIVQWPHRQWDIGVAIKHSYRQLGYALEAEIESMVKKGVMKSIFQQYHMSYERPALYLPQQ